MSLEKIYVTRHGFRSPWVVDPATGNYTASFRSPTGLPTDPALTSHGVEQAAELAQHLQQLDPPVEQVYSSPYYRCLQTVHPFVSRNVELHQKGQSSGPANGCLSIRADEGLSEWYGLANFDHPTAAPLNELQRHFPEIDANYVSTLTPARQGESIPELHERVATCIQEIIARSDREGRKTVLMPEDVSTEDFGAFTCGLSTYRRQGYSKTEGNTTSSDGLSMFRGSTRTPAAAPQGVQDRGAPDACSKIDLVRHADQGRKLHPAASWGGWTCEINSDCSFLRCGEERGWKFSGDESFLEMDRVSLLRQNPDPSNKNADGDARANRTKTSTKL
ncbi:phosphoglycerate mutase-like protein [Xylariomycetidae sp. FL0641]|nr:phosphoglycerate mutase-like protein [Xylariomycetidae sp. FL0641]